MEWVSLNIQDLNSLRSAGLLNDDEVAYTVGDIVVAENVITKQRRIIQESGRVLESKKQLLKG